MRAVFVSEISKKNVNTNAIDPVTRLMRAVFVVEISKKNVNTNAISSFLSPHPTFLTPHSSFLSFMVLVGLKWPLCTTANADPSSVSNPKYLANTDPSSGSIPKS